ncbi:ABC-2 transporter permease [Paraliobacillus zengyii]|uniref:ABC-2 transporter permease n=1 Tax=Paraliobacillus zengyii TaxID=2213194 RepID=UPI000DD2F259|nr:ABC-2 transporter permease [Paraliobacillus zengyii]
MLFFRSYIKMHWKEYRDMVLLSTLFFIGTLYFSNQPYFIVSLLNIFFVSSLFERQEKVKLNRFIISMPANRNMLIVSQFYGFLSYVCLLALIQFFLYYLISNSFPGLVLEIDSLKVVSIISCFIIGIISILMLVSYKMDTDSLKYRAIWSFGLISPTYLFFLVTNDNGQSAIESIINTKLDIFIMILIMLVVFLISLRYTISLFNKKERI